MYVKAVNYFAAQWAGNTFIYCVLIKFAADW
jgi:hypothetical protein